MPYLENWQVELLSIPTVLTYPTNIHVPKSYFYTDYCLTGKYGNIRQGRTGWIKTGNLPYKEKRRFSKVLRFK